MRWAEDGPELRPARHLHLLVRLLALATALAVLAACRPATPPAASLVYGSLLEPASLNPLLAPDLASRQAIELVYDGLVAADDSLILVPRLAERWSTADDGRTWTFHLRRGVRWHDGRDFSAADVVFTYRALLDPRLSSGGATLPRGDYAVIERVEALDAATVRFTLRQPYAPFLSRLTLGIVPSHLLAGGDLRAATLNRQPVGTGPYVLREWRPAQQLTFEANADYFGGRPAIPRIVWKVVPDSAALTLQLLAGEVGAGPIPDPLDRERLRSDPRFAVATAVGGNTQVSFQLSRPLFQDVRVRRALARGLDARAIVQGVLRGEARLAVSDIPPTSWASDPTLRPLEHDAAEAHRLLAAAGWARGPDGVYARDGRPFAFTLWTYAGDRVREATLLVVQAQWRELGLRVDVATQERNSFVANRVLRGDFDAALLESAVQVDPDLSRRFHSASIAGSGAAPGAAGQAGQNFLGYRSAALDALLERAVATTEVDARRSLYAEAQRLLLSDLPQVPLYHATQAYAFPRGVVGVRPTPLGPFWNVAEWRLE